MLSAAFGFFKTIFTAAQPTDIYQFKITLKGSNPKIWRRIQVPGKYNFHQFHRAIQRSMGWKSVDKDYHLHEFQVTNPRSMKKDVVGMPHPQGSPKEVRAATQKLLLQPVVAEKKAKIADYFVPVNKRGIYKYDFEENKDANWQHQILFETVLRPEASSNYPKCVAGERACPPEDCGGVDGYERLLKTMADPKHEEYHTMKEWLEHLGHVNGELKSEEFDPKLVFEMY